MKSKSGIGKSIVICYYAPQPARQHYGDKFDTIFYDFKSMPNDIDLINNEDDLNYCLKQCTKMGYYASKMHKIEILKMKCEFAKDDNGTIWF